MDASSVQLRPVIQEDSSYYFKWINDEALVLQNSNFRPVSELEHQQWFAQIGLNPQVQTFSIVETQHERLIGSCSLRHIDLLHRNAELQIRIGEVAFQNIGLGTQAVNQLVEYGFYNLGLQRIYLHVFSYNTRAIRAYEKSNFSVEGTLRKGARINGQFIDLILMSIVR